MRRETSGDDANGRNKGELGSPVFGASPTPIAVRFKGIALVTNAWRAGARANRVFGTESPDKAPDHLERNGVSNLLGYLGTIASKFVIVGKGLKTGRFAERDRAVISRMCVTPPSDVGTPGRQGRGNVIPLHATINVAEIPRISVLVASKLQMVREAGATSAILWNRREPP